MQPIGLVLEKVNSACLIKQNLFRHNGEQGHSDGSPTVRYVIYCMSHDYSQTIAYQKDGAVRWLLAHTADWCPTCCKEGAKDD